MQSNNPNQTAAFIPVRGGSKSIPLKNIKIINGKPLVYWTVKAAVECRYIDKVYVATDSPVIKETVESFGFEKVSVISRSAETASDTASTESAMLEFAGNYNFDTIVLIQATSPLLTAHDLDGGFALYHSGADSVLSVVRQKRFIWETVEGTAQPQNYNPLNRPRRQEFEGYLVENGAFYITSRARLLDTKCRISGVINAYEMPEETYFEIDEPSDWVIIEKFLKQKYSIPAGYSERLKKIRMFLTDCDGCLTDGGMYYSKKGDELKKFNTRDGMGLALLRKNGILTGVITGEKSEIVQRRAEKLQLEECHLGISDKLALVKNLCKKYGITLEEIAYIGDDINDLAVIQAVGFGCAPANAAAEVKAAAQYITAAKGGEGAVREAAELLLSARKQEK